MRPAQFAALEQDRRRQIALSVLEDVRTSAPHAISGLSKAEVNARLETALRKAEAYKLNSPDDIEAYVRLSFMIGPKFDEYPPFKKILKNGGPRTGRAFPELFDIADDDDWHKAAQFDIVRRYREPIPTEPSSEERLQQAVVPAGPLSLIPLENRHAESYFVHVLHPDVWRLARIKPPETVEDIHQSILAQDRMYGATYAIVDAGEEFLGATFAGLRDGAIQISYWIARPLWGKDVATQALKQFTEGLRQENGESLTLRIEPGNIPSIKVATKCGFKKTGDSSGTLFVLEA